MIGSFNIEKGNFILNNENIPEIIFIEKNNNQHILILWSMMKIIFLLKF